MRVRVLWFAALRERVGKSEELIETGASTPAALYAELDARSGLAFSMQRLRVAVNGEFVDWQSALMDEAEVAFLPPVSGG
jgi:molybdopterin synthase sulfur carrier subunit